MQINALTLDFFLNDCDDAITDKVKVNAKHYAGILLLGLIEECKSLPPSGFIFQQDGAPPHMAKLAQNCIATNCSEFIGKDERPLNSPDVNPLDYHVWGDTLKRYKTFHCKSKDTDRLKKVLQLIWDQLPQDSINKAVLSFTKTHRALVKAGLDI